MKLNKTVILGALMVFISTTVFSIDKIMGTTAQLNANFTTTFGADLDTQDMGFEENLNLGILWQVGGYETQSTPAPEDDFPFGEAVVTGGIVKLKFENLTITDQGDTNKATSFTPDIWFENAYARLVLNNYYMQIFKDYDGSAGHNSKVGFNFDTSLSSIGSNWAHIGPRVNKSYLFGGEQWEIQEGMDNVKDSKNEAGIAVGMDLENFRTYVAVGSDKGMEDNVDNQFDFSLAAEYKPLAEVTVLAGATTGINYKNGDDNTIPLGFGGSAEYGYVLTDTIKLKPFVAFDGLFVADGDDSFAGMNKEIAYGITIEWPGHAGYGYEWLQDSTKGKTYGAGEGEGHRYPGASIAGISIETGEDDFMHNFHMSVYEESVGGIIPNLGGSLIFEIKDVTDTTTEGIKLAYGVYTEYDLMGYYVPFVQSSCEDILIDDSDDLVVELSVGIKIKTLANTEIQLRYDNDVINAIGKSGESESRGQVRAMVNITL